jgi:hypothetical protein
MKILIGIAAVFFSYQALAMGPAPKDTWQCITSGSWHTPPTCPGQGHPSPGDPGGGHNPCPPERNSYWSDHLATEKEAANQAVARCLDQDPEPSQCDRSPECRYSN